MVKDYTYVEDDVYKFPTNVYKVNDPKDLILGLRFSEV